MKRLVFTFSMLLFLFGACNPQPDDYMEDAKSAARDGIFIHISSDDPHRVLMALSLAHKMSEDKDVMVFFDINGVEVVNKNSEDIVHAEFESSKTLLSKLLESNVLIEACPMCLKAAGYTEEDLMKGVHPAQKEDFFNFTNGRILTLDY